MVSAEAPERPIAGDIIAEKYRIEGVAGEGGMGVVYEATHVILGQRVAIKVLLPGTVTSTEMVDRFSLEARALASINSQHVVRVLDAGALPNGAPYLVMEYLEGSDLGALLLRRGPMEPAKVADYALQALEALANAHAASIIHRDLKPTNLFLIDRAEERPLVKLLDFGVSKSTESYEDRKLSGARILGSLPYMSPEQLRKGVLDRRTDLWSLGVVMYELLSGELPFGGEFGDLITSVLQAEAPSLSSVSRAVSQDLAKVVARCMKRDVNARWNDAAELARALAPHGTGAWAELPDQIEKIVRRPPRSRPARQFQSYDNALQALEAERKRDPTVPDAAEQADTEPPAGLEHPQARVTRLPERLPLEVTTIRILLIDDSEITLAVHDHLLKSAGFEVRTTMTAGEFEAVLEGWAPHLVLMDVQMPDVTGDVLCKRVKARVGKSVPVVLVSDLPNNVLESRARSAGADAFLRKMSDGVAFVEFVRNICAIAYSPDALPARSDPR